MMFSYSFQTNNLAQSGVKSNNRHTYAALLCGVLLTTICACTTNLEVSAIENNAIQSTSIPEHRNKSSLANYRTRPAEDEVIYFMLPDRFENGDTSNDTGGYTGSRLEHGFDPTHRGFYHGGDLKGLTSRLDYIQDLGASAIWLGPIYKNKPVQGGTGAETSGYHGYWITDFLDVDPHLGTKEDLKKFVQAAHARNMKVYLDIITNHTADVIKFKECHNPNTPKADWIWDCPYLSKGDYPYSTLGGINGNKINQDFLGDSDEYQSNTNFAKLTNPNYAYTPYVPVEEAKTKNPAWLNDPLYYHNRGDSDWWGESALYGDFAGLDDLFTEHPRVIEGMIEIFKFWISEYQIDGFRIDTAKHVNAEFWQQFLPAMQEHAASIGIPNFYMFGEVYDQTTAGLAKTTRTDGFEQVLDFAFQNMIMQLVAGQKDSEDLNYFLMQDALYANGQRTALRLPVFLGNHDMGRLSGMLKQQIKNITQDELLERVKVAHALMFFLRGVPVIYSGDEQGFVSDGNDQLAREDMFASRVKEYNDNNLLGTDKTTADDNFDVSHPLFQFIAKLSGLRRNHSALSKGELKLRLSQRGERVIAFSRIDPKTSEEILVVINADNQARSINVETDYRTTHFTTLLGDCAVKPMASGSMSFDLDPFEINICKGSHR